MFNYTTTKANLDAPLIEKVNNPLGWVITNITVNNSVSLTIQGLDLSGLQGIDESYGSYAEKKK